MALRLDRKETALLVIDIQEKLAAAMDDAARAGAVKNAGVLVSGMRALGVPVLYSEQYPQGLGPTVPELRSLLGEAARLEKTEFDCTAAPGFQLPKGVRSVVLAGMEAHICVLQTAVGLRERGLDVWVAEDAVCSRAPRNYESALRLLERGGAVVAPTESILFGLLGKAGTPEFKTISKLVR
jgi:nicotinamidase-related amidase